MYAAGRPNCIAALFNRATTCASSAGLAPRRLVTLEVPGRRSGRLLATPVVVADVAGERYLVAMLGPTTQWVRNVRAAGGRAVLRHGRRTSVTLEEVPVDRRAPVLKRYLALAPGARAHFAVDRGAPESAFAAVAADYPVFRIVAD